MGCLRIDSFSSLCRSRVKLIFANSLVAPNPLAARWIYLCFDPSHLLKVTISVGLHDFSVFSHFSWFQTVRNGLYSSKADGSKYFTINGKDVFWDHVFDLYQRE